MIRKMLSKINDLDNKMAAMQGVKFNWGAIDFIKYVTPRTLIIIAMIMAIAYVSIG